MLVLLCDIIWKDEEVFTGNSDDEDEDDGFDAKHAHPHHRNRLPPLARPTYISPYTIYPHI